MSKQPKKRSPSPTQHQQPLPSPHTQSSSPPKPTAPGNWILPKPSPVDIHVLDSVPKPSPTYLDPSSMVLPDSSPPLKAFKSPSGKSYLIPNHCLPSYLTPIFSTSSFPPSCQIDTTTANLNLLISAGHPRKSPNQQKRLRIPKSK